MEEWVHIHTDGVHFGYDITCTPNNGFSLHCHNLYEVYYFLEGNVEYQVEGRKYILSPHSLLLFSPHVFHGVRVIDETPYRRFSLHFHPRVLTLERRSFLLSCFPPPEVQPAAILCYEHLEPFGLCPYFEAIKECALPGNGECCAPRNSKHCAPQDSEHHASQNIFTPGQEPSCPGKHPMSEKMREQMLPISIEALLSRIVLICGQKSPSQNTEISETISQIIWYLNCHLQEEISLDQLSDHFYISKHHLNKVFRRATGTTVFDYLLRKRVITAQQLLINGASAQEACAHSGFSDYSAFYRAYVRILGHSPIEDRGTLSSLRADTAEDLQVLDLPVGRSQT